MEVSNSQDSNTNAATLSSLILTEDIKQETQDLIAELSLTQLINDYPELSIQESAPCLNFISSTAVEAGKGGYKYTSDLLALDACRAPEGRPMPPALTVITTPLRLQQWEAALQGFPDEQLKGYILQGIVNGFRVGFDYVNHATKASTHNMPAARENPEPVDSFLAKEIAEHRVAGPFVAEVLPHLHISQLGVVPKKHQANKWRLILHLSAPRQHSVNDGINPSHCSIKYGNVDQAAAIMARLGKGTQMAKIDIAHAYRNVPIHPADRMLLGMKWRNAVYVDTVLPFGLRSAPKIFSAISDTLEWIIKTAGIEHCIHYLDDFLTFGKPESEECTRRLEAIIAICRLLGLPLALEKVEGPVTCITFLGILLDSLRMEMRLPAEKLETIKALIETWLTRRKAQKRDMLSLIGHLSHAAKVIPPGRTFIRRMRDVAHSKRELYHWIYLNADFKSDLMWWKLFTDRWHGISCIRSHVMSPPDFTLYSDASGSWGCGAICNSHWLQCEWNGIWQAETIALKELLPIVLAVALWGRWWAESHILAMCDNMAVVDILKSHTSKHPKIMHLLRCLHFFVAKWEICLRAEHIPGVCNNASDAISRNLMQAFRRAAPQADRDPVPVPSSLWEMLVTQQPDWTSSAWRLKLSTFWTEVSHLQPLVPTMRGRERT